MCVRKAGAVDPEWETNPQKAFFQRASRTDKGVSAVKMIVSLKLLDDKDIIRKAAIFS
jgi:tRNA U38,U39,U40 pseudouridine synthase TruA